MNLMDSFQVGQQAQGSSAIGAALNQIVDRIKMHDELKLKSQAQISTSVGEQSALMPGKLEFERQKMEMDPEKQLYENLNRTQGVPGAESTAGGGSPGGPFGGFQMSKIQAGPFTYENPQVQAEMASAKESQIRLEKLRDAVPILKTFEARLMELPGPSTPQERITQAPGIFLKSVTQADPKLAAFEKFRTGMRSQVARMLGEVGNLAKDEQINAINLMPDIYDTFETKSQKLNNFYSYVVERIAARNQIGEEQAATLLGVQWDPRTRSVNSSSLSSVRQGTSEDSVDQSGIQWD